MIVGQGLLARAFAARYAADPDVTIFASGVSNSLATAAADFERERAMLAPLLGTGPRLVYFGSCGSAPGNEAATPYMRHKRAMEEWVAGSANGLVLRLPQVVGVTANPNTLTNFLRDRILSGEPFTVWANAQRNLIDVDDVVAIAAGLIGGDAGGGRVFSIASADPLPMLKMFDKQLTLRMGQANVRRWLPDLWPLVTAEEDRLGLESFATQHLSLEDAPEAYASFQAKDPGFAKVVFRP